MGAPIETAIAKLGNSIGVRIPRSVAEQANLHKGDQVSVAVKGPGIIVIRAFKKEVTLDSLLSVRLVAPYLRIGEGILFGKHAGIQACLFDGSVACLPICLAHQVPEKGLKARVFSE